MKRLILLAPLIIMLSGCADFLYQPERSRQWPDLGVQIAVVMVPDETGVVVRRDFLIRGVRPGTPAENAGVKAGDLLLSLDGRLINSVSAALDVMRSKTKMDTVLLVVERDGETRQFLISLANAALRSEI
ncbi:MAG: PDZ domain-containing protein [Arenicellales bacterium]|nr:PDZ domain-containing protein [Arenicellales bacterium]MEE1558841.1 PDZ domain-containing protein [Arenicellales bacterium]MEE1566909.1 PDZ domain-containing protein [Arenicellales bacterium]